MMAMRMTTTMLMIMTGMMTRMTTTRMMRMMMMMERLGPDPLIP